MAAALCALSTTLAAPAPDLKGATLCLSPLLAVSVTAEAGTSLPLAGLETRLTAEWLRELRASLGQLVRAWKAANPQLHTNQRNS